MAGFLLERELGRGTETVVYEAIQVALGRRVALKVLPAEGARAGPLRWPDHPRVVSLYATGSWEGGRFIAMQLVRGRSLAQLLDAGELDPAASLDFLADVGSALDAAHGAGIAHGRVAARNVLVDGNGTALLSDFGVAADGASVAADRAAFAALVRECLGGLQLADPRSCSAGELVRLAREEVPPAPARRGPRRRRARTFVGAGICALAAVAVAIVLGSDQQPESVPPVERGARALGSALTPGDVRSVDCGGRPPSGSSQACNVVQTQLPGRRLVPSRSGVIRRWVVRGARGELALQVIRRRGDRYVSIARSRYERVPDEGVHVLRANLAVRRGDRIGVEMAPGAAIGVRRGASGATTARWIGPLFLVGRPVERGEGTGFDHELLVRADYVAGAEARLRGQLTGRSARRAPDGRELLSRIVEVRGHVRRITVVELSNGIALDLFAGDRRLVRVPAPDADPAGRPQSFTAAFGSGTGARALRWRNPGGRTVKLEYTVGAWALSPRS